MDSSDGEDVSNGDSSAEDIVRSKWEQKSLKCELCNATYESEKNFDDHVKLHGELRFYSASFRTLERPFGF